MVREKRESERQNLGFSSRPFVLCGLPVQKPATGALLHERRNGQFLLQVTGHPNYGLPWGQDRLVPIFLATLAVRQQKQTITFRSASEMLDTFGMQQGGSQYRRLIGAFQRVFGATIFFGTDSQRDKAAVIHQARFNFMAEARIWYSRDPAQQSLPGDCQNMIVLSDEFYREIHSHRRTNPGRPPSIQVAAITEEFVDALADRLISRMRSSIDEALTRQLLGAWITEYSEDPRK